MNQILTVKVENPFSQQSSVFFKLCENDEEQSSPIKLDERSRRAGRTVKLDERYFLARQTVLSSGMNPAIPHAGQAVLALSSLL